MCAVLTMRACPPAMPAARSLLSLLICVPARLPCPPSCSIVSLLDIFEIDNNTFATVLELVQASPGWAGLCWGLKSCFAASRCRLPCSGHLAVLLLQQLAGW